MSENQSLKKTRGPNLKKRQRTRNRLIEATKTLLLTKPADEITINDITSAADCALGTFYNYFLSKTLIMDAVMSDIVDTLIEEINDDFESSGVDKTIDRLTVGFRLLALKATNDSNTGFLLFESGLPLKNLIYGLENFIETELERGEHEKAVKAPDATLAATLTAGSLANMLMKQYAGYYEQTMADVILSNMLKSELVVEI